MIGKEKPADVRPADLLQPELEKAREDGKKLGIIHKEEDVITYALYPQVAVKFLRGEIKEAALPPSARIAEPESQAAEFPMEFTVDVDGEIFNVKVSSILGKTIEVEKNGKAKEKPAGAVVSPMSGMILSIKVKAGSKIDKGDVVAIIEAMKMQNEIRSDHSGTVKEILSYESEVIRCRRCINGGGTG